LLTFVQQGLTSALLLGLGYFVISTISENILWPKFLGRGLNMSAAYILVSAFVFGWLMGIPGILLSGPLSVFLLLVLSLFKETSWITNMIVTRQQTEISEEN
jgi:predicted PurR-regulated permease PerM